MAEFSTEQSIGRRALLEWFQSGKVAELYFQLFIQPVNDKQAAGNAKYP